MSKNGILGDFWSKGLFKDQAQNQNQPKIKGLFLKILVTLFKIKIDFLLKVRGWFLWGCLGVFG